MKSLEAINQDNRMTSRDFGGMCEWFVFCAGDLLACFVEESDAREFAANYEFEGGEEITISQAKP